MNDELLFKKIKHGDEEAFEELFHTYYKPLVRFVWGYVKSEAIAEEITQDLFTKLWQESTSLTIRSSVKSYLYSAARNMSLNHLKHREIEQEWEKEKKALYTDQPHESTLNKKLHDKMILEEVEQVIQDLPERRRLIFVLSRHQDMTYKEIARFLDISENTVDTQIRRALATLREHFSGILSYLVGISILLS
ncbi:MAG: RNA polymerase sigma-70 factor [Balneolaceae bacterium]|nr:RNA polymerase sigma-70 factor [Balneolaceae bacterium]